MDNRELKERLEGLSDMINNLSDGIQLLINDLKEDPNTSNTIDYDRITKILEELLEKYRPVYPAPNPTPYPVNPFEIPVTPYPWPHTYPGYSPDVYYKTISTTQDGLLKEKDVK